MHPIQKKLIDLIDSREDAGSLSLRKMAEIVGVPNRPQTIKHHLQQLEKNGLIQINLEEKHLKLVRKGYNKPVASPLYSLPVVGMANCGPAADIAEENVSQYLKVSSRMLPRNKERLYALIADGQSMNKAKVDGKTIEDGDFVLVDGNCKTFKNGDIVVAVIDGMATIKKCKFNKEDKTIILEAESTEKYLPIFLHEGDDFLLNGKVIGIIKAN